MAERRARRALLLAAALASAGACTTEVDHGDIDRKNSDPRLLDDFCGTGSCTTTGSAKRISGVLGGSVAFRLGPGEGSLRVPVPSSFDHELTRVLLKGNGRVCVGQGGTSVSSADCISAPSSLTWVGAYVPSSGSLSTGARVLDISVRDGTSEIEVLDVGWTEELTSCSVSSPGRRAGRAWRW